MKTWMRRRGDRVRITGGKYSGHTGTIESNVYQRTMDYPDEWANGYHVMLDTEVLVTVRCGQVAAGDRVKITSGKYAAARPVNDHFEDGHLRQRFSLPCRVRA